MLKDNLKTLRRMTGLNQRQLADELGVSVKTVSHWEAGYSEPSLSMLSRLRRVLKVFHCFVPPPRREVRSSPTEKFSPPGG